MSRYKPVTTVRADDFDPDEAATFRGALSFLAGQRVAYHFSKLQALQAPETPEQVQEQVDHMAAILLELLDSWTLRTPDTAYEPGVDRPKWDLTLEAIGAQPLDTILFLYTEGMRLFATQTAPPADVITPAAAAEGLQPG